MQKILSGTETDGNHRFQNRFLQRENGPRRWDFTGRPEAELSSGRFAPGESSGMLSGKSSKPFRRRNPQPPLQIHGGFSLRGFLRQEGLFEPSGKRISA